MNKKEALRKDNKNNAADTKVQKEFFIVGIGASAGGIQALQKFFRHVPASSDMAYIVILHLSPNHDSQLAGVLQHETSMPVIQVVQKTKIQVDHVYVVPPDHHLTVDGGEIAVLPNMQFEDRRAPVDIFFRSLANAYGARAVSVILSGTGANGSMGLKRVKELGGATYVQNPMEAEFNEMPRNAIATELVDEVLNVNELPGRILSYRNGVDTFRIVEAPSGTAQEIQQQALQSIFTQLKLRTGHDFSNYKRPTLLRRIERRINVQGLADLPSYVHTLTVSPDETHALLKDLLISVTNFFRDPSAFSYLEQNVIPALFSGKGSGDQVRIWVAGCATGEEAYSIAMLCAEHALRTVDSPKIQIFATDIDETAIATAREGLYTINDAADVSPERLKQFFSREGDLHRVKKEIREMILFADHNFLKDPPFSKLDLVSCRNVLIYLNATAQARVIESFHFALRLKAFLFLGSSESVDGTSDLYTAFSRDHHLYQTREIAQRNYPIPDSAPRFESVRNSMFSPQRTEIGVQVQRVSFGELHQKMLEEYAPPSVVVNQAYDIVHMSQKAGRYFEFSGGEPTQNLLRLVSPQIRLELRAALFQALQFKGPIEIHNIRTVVQGEMEALDIHIRPALKDGDVAQGFILIIFKPAQDQAHDPAMVVVKSHEPVAKHLEEELIGLKSQLRDSIEYHEYQAEELKASNEELQAMNEELRSAAEELETSKEELQSINEELRTVNQELKVKIEETSLSSSNLKNLINSASVATIFVDRNFSIRLYTPSILEIFNLKPGDYGRPITDITHKLKFENLLLEVEAVLENLTTIEQEVHTTDDRTFLMRLLPYRTSEDRIGGVVITFFDITSRRESEIALKQSEERMRMLIEGVKDYAIFMTDPEGLVVVWNAAAQLIFGYQESEILGSSVDVLFTAEDQKSKQAEFQRAQSVERGRVEDERWHIRKDGRRFWGSGVTHPILSGGKVSGYVKIMRDLTEQRRLEDALKKSEERYRTELEKEVDERTAELSQSKEQYLTLVENTPDLVTRWNHDHQLIFANTAFEQLKVKEELIKSYAEALKKAFKSAQTFELFSTTDISGEIQYFHSRLTPERNQYGSVETVLAMGRDITEIKKAEIALNQGRDLLQSILDNSSIGMSMLLGIEDDHGRLTDFKIILTNRELERETGRTDLIGKLYAQEYPGIVTSGLFKLMEQVYRTGESSGLEYHYPYDGFNKWYSCRFVKIGNSILATNLDITERKLAEEQMKSSEQRLRMFVSASSDLIFQMDAQWREMLVLKGDRILAGTSSGIQDWMDHYIPAAEQASFKHAINRAIAKKSLFELEHQLLLADGTVGWASSRAIPLLDQNGQIIEWFGVATDITERIKFEQERNKNFLLLQQSEEVAGTGTWDYDLSSGKMTWSEGMYSIFDKTRESEIGPGVYHQYASAEDFDTGLDIVSRIKTGRAGFEANLRIVVGEQTKELKLTAMVIPSSEGKPIRVLGVDMDVTLSRQAEKRMQTLEAENQLEIFRATLTTQDEERRRISESLHNGLGQLLYGIKLSIESLSRTITKGDVGQLSEAMKYTETLLTEAIRESRSISHRLMPAALEQFGLASAIDDVCKQLSGEIQFKCSYKGLKNRLESYLELAIYRTVQELMLNVIKHSEASLAEVFINVELNQIKIFVKDNGKGMDSSTQTKTGIGLTSILSKIKLLKGSVDFDSKPGKGTKVSVYIPLQPKSN